MSCYPDVGNRRLQLIFASRTGETGVLKGSESGRHSDQEISPKV